MGTSRQIGLALVDTLAIIGRIGPKGLLSSCITLNCLPLFSYNVTALNGI